jgi:uncharacterized protein YjbI with pentapeptide repeats
MLVVTVGAAAALLGLSGLWLWQKLPMFTVGAAAALLGFAWWFWWQLPKRQVARLSLKLRDAKARADVEDNFRKTVSQLLGGATVLIGAGFAYLQFSQQQQASHDLLISNQVAKGFEHLGSDKPVIRLGGIYALEGVMNTSEQYRRPVLEALCAFVRDGTKTVAVNQAVATDSQSALTVIARRRYPELGDVNLAEAHIPTADLGGAKLSGANLTGAILSDANLTGAILSGAILGGAKLNGANLIRANLSNAHLNRANLSGAYLSDANLSGAELLDATLIDAHLIRANLSGVPLIDANLSHAGLYSANLSSAHLEGANLSGAELTDANLRNASLNGANLSGAILGGAKLNGADLRGATVSQTQLDAACGTDMMLPTGLNLKPCPSP